MPADTGDSAGASSNNGSSRYLLKRMRIREAIEAHPDATNTWIAKLIGTSRDTVIDVKRSMKPGAPAAGEAKPGAAKQKASAGEAEGSAGAGLPVVINEGTDSVTALIDIRYQTMCRAIAECAAVDEVKKYRDKAVALEVYARQAKNFEAERKAQEIRVRAERQAGKLLKSMPKAQGARLNGRDESGNFRVSIDTTAEEARTLAEQKITRDNSAQWQKLAEVPDETFEAVVTDQSEPISAARVIETHRASQEDEALIVKPAKKAPVRKQAHAKLHSLLLAFEREIDPDSEPDALFHAMTEAMQLDVRRIAPGFIAILQVMIEASDAS